MKKVIILLLFFISVSGLFSQEPQTFFNIQNIDVNTEYADFGVTFYKDNRVIFASSKKDKSIKRKERSHNRMEYLQFYKGTVNKNGQIQNVAKFSTEKFNLFHESDITFANDGKTIYFTFNNYINNKFRKNFLFSMSKKKILNIFKGLINENGVVSNISPLPFNEKKYSISHPRLSPDGKTLFFISDMDDSYGGTDIYKVAIHENGEYGKPENLGLKINTEGNEMFPFLSNENIFYFSSDGHKGEGGLDIFSSKLENNKFSQVQNLSQLNYTNDDFAFVINEELNVGYFSSVREGNNGNADIYSFNIKPDECNQTIVGTIKNNKTLEPLAKVKVQLFNNGKLLESVFTKENGTYKFTINCGISYQIKVSNTELIDKEKYLNSTSINGSSNTVNFNLLPKPTIDCDQNISGVVQNIETGNILENARVSLIINNIVIETTQTSNDGSFKFKELIECKSKYTIKTQHIDFESRTNEIKANNSISKENKINILLQKIEAIEEFITQNGVILIKTNPINFDLNKSDIRDDAAIELNRVVRVMNNNPQIKVELNLHTDSRAPDDYNMTLSNDRAKSSIDYIISQGINPLRISGKGYGETRLINRCSNGVKCTNAEHEVNRRVEFIVTNK